MLFKTLCEHGNSILVNVTIQNKVIKQTVGLSPPLPVKHWTTSHVSQLWAGGWWSRVGVGQFVCRFGALLQVGCRADIGVCTCILSSNDCTVSCAVYSKIKEQLGNRLSQKPPGSHYIHFLVPPTKTLPKSPPV